MIRPLLLALALSGCSLAPHEAPYCAVSYGDPNRQGERAVMCACQSGAEIPAECGGGIAPTDGQYGGGYAPDDTVPAGTP